MLIHCYSNKTVSNPCPSLSPVIYRGKLFYFINVPDSKSRNIPEVVIVRRGAVGDLGIWRGWVSWVKGGANGVSLQAT
jgi:hypothetical protein